MTLKSDLTKAVSKAGLTTSAAAKKIGVTYPAIKAVMDGKSFPNSRSLGKYAQFLGVPEAKLKASVEKEKDATGRRPGRPRKDGSKKKSPVKKAAGKKKTAAKKKSTAKKKTAAKRGPGRPRKTVAAKRGPGRPRKTTAAKRGPGRPRKAVAPAPKVDKRLVRSLKASLKDLDALRAKIEGALAKLQ